MTGQLREQLQSSLGSAYTIERELGGGGMSRVFVATETRYGRRVVVKVLAPELSTGLSTGRFEREIGLAASLQQANIVPVLTSGDVNGLPFYTMPFVEGRSLRARLVDGQIPVTEVVSILRDLARALAYAHDRHVVHRDIKPDNVLLSGGTAVVTDFGIAKAIVASRTHGDGDDPGALTQLGVTLGTPAYMAPEQAAGDPSADHRSDLYAFGCLAYELLASQPPFHGLPPHRLLASHMGARPVPVHDIRPDTPPGLAALVMQCLEKEPSQRPQNAQEIAQALDSITSGSSAAMPGVLHGRVSLGTALGIWAAVFAATWILAKAAIVGIGLPDWVLPGALVVAGLGLPAVLATYWVQRATQRAMLTTPGGSKLPASTIRTFALKASPHISWRRTWRGGAIAAGTFVLLVAAFMAARAMGIGPAGSLVGKGVLKENDTVVLSRVSTTSADTAMAGVLSEALRSELAQSRVISVLPPSAIRGALTRMQRSADTVLTEALAREVAGREGAKLVIAADVSPLGSGYVLNARLVDPTTGDPLESARATANDADGLLQAVSRVTRALRERIGESLKSIQNSPRLERVTTPSFAAFRKYTEAIEWSEGVNYDPDRAKALLLEAVALDSTFAMAWRKLGWLDFEPVKQVEYFSNAFRHREKLSDLERHQVEGSYYWLVTGDLDRAITSHLEATRLDSTVPRNMGNLSMLYGDKHDYERALDWAMRAERVDSTQTGAYSFPHLLALKRFREADSVLGRVRQISGDSASTTLSFAGWLHWVREQWDSLPEHLRRAERVGGPPAAAVAVQIQFIKAALGLMQGRAMESKEIITSLYATELQRGVAVPSVFLTLIPAQIDVFVREDFSAIARLDSAVRATRFEQIPGANQVYLQLAVAYSLGRSPDRARQMLARYDSAITDTMQRRRESAQRREAVGWIAMASGRPNDAIPEFRAATAMKCYACALADLGLAFELAGQRDSAVFYYNAYDQLGQTEAFADAAWRPLILRKLGELHEQRGEIEKAIPYYQRFVAVWKNPDPDLKPKVDAVRAKLRNFAQTERR